MPPQAPLQQRRLLKGQLPIGIIITVLLCLVSWWSLDQLLGVNEIQYPESEWAFEESGIRELQKTSGWDGSGVNVCIVDTGVDLDHDDLDTIGLKFRDFVGGSEAPIDHGLDNHGTMMTGILAADGHLKGVAPGVTLFVAAALGEYEDGDTVGDTALVAQAVEWCWEDMGADIISLSLGGEQQENSTSGKEVEEAVEEAINKGVYVVAAAGNDGGPGDDGLVSSPANIPLVISVGASAEGGNLWDSSSRDESTFGPDGSPREAPNEKPELLAPGAGIISTAPGGQYFRSSGTSGATVFVAGTLALILEGYPEMSRSGGSATNSCIVAMKQALMDSMSDGDGDVQHDSSSGYGGLDAMAWSRAVYLQQSDMQCGL